MYMCSYVINVTNFQWIALIRKHAEVVADDETVFPVFKNFCVVCIKFNSLGMSTISA